MTDESGAGRREKPEAGPRPVDAVREIEHHRFMKMADAIAALSDVRPRLARAAFDEAISAVFERIVGGENISEETPVEISPGFSLTLAQANAAKADDGWSAARITPYGARILLDMYRDGRLPKKPGRPAPPDLSVLESYAESTEALAAASREAREKRDAEQAERDMTHRRLVENPHLIREEDFSYRLLNDLFFSRIGRGSGRLTIAGLVVAKSVAVYSSNSGKSRDTAVRFAWIGSDGEPREVSKESLYQANRRNDADRNWGLPD